MIGRPAMASPSPAVHLNGSQPLSDALIAFQICISDIRRRARRGEGHAQRRDHRAGLGCRPFAGHWLSNSAIKNETSKIAP
jgi:hypothetical protein